MRLARPQAYLLVRVLRERRQSCCLGGNRQTDDAEILCSAYGPRTLELARFRPRERGALDSPDGLRSGNGQIPADFLGRGAGEDRRRAPRVTAFRQGGVLYVRPRIQ